MGVVFIVSLILVVLDLDEIRVDSIRIQTQRDQRIDGGRLRDDLERPALLILELNEILVVLDHFVALVLGFLEQLGKREPLSGHLIAVVGVDELVIVDAVTCVSFHTSDSRLAGVEGYDVVDKSLSLWGELDALAWVL